MMSRQYFIPASQELEAKGVEFKKNAKTADLKQLLGEQMSEEIKQEQEEVVTPEEGKGQEEEVVLPSDEKKEDEEVTDWEAKYKELEEKNLDLNE